MSPNISFENVERKVYPRTFLNTVFVIFKSDTSNDQVNILTKIQQFVKDNFNLDVQLTGKEFADGFRINSKDGGHSYLFSRDRIGVKYTNSDYVSFTETMMPLIYRLISFTKNVLNSPQLDEVQIRKINVWDFKETESLSVNHNQVVADLLSQELISNAETDNGYMKLTEGKRLLGDFSSSSYEIHYGFRQEKNPEGENYSGLVLDESVVNTHVNLAEVEEVLASLNSLLFNIFHWSVSSNTIALMNQEL